MSKTILALVAALALAACGNTAQDRMLSGAVFGAGAGALVGGMTTPQPYRGRYR